MDLESVVSQGGAAEPSTLRPEPRFGARPPLGSAPGPAPRRAVPVADDAVEVVLARLDQGPERVRASASLLSDAERARATRFAFERDRRRFILARARLRQLLGARLATDPGTIELAHGAHGKPELAGRFERSNLRFNLSHCDDLAVYAFALGREVGIDLESVRVMADADDVAARMFSARENRAYRALEPRDRPLAFFSCWTRKEAFIKALGDGLQHPLDRFDVSLAPGEPARILRVDDTPGERCGWHMQGFSPARGFVAAVVVADRERAADLAPPHPIAGRTSWPR